MESLSNKIHQRLEQHTRQLTEQQQQLDIEMKTALDNQELFAAEAKRILTSIVTPKVVELACHFENATLAHHEPRQEHSCFCFFAHSLRFPATVSLSFTMAPGETQHELKVIYNMEILPVFMAYSRNDTLQATFDDDGRIASWVEYRILEFLDTYLKIETHPLYQKDNLVLDPVCGMRIPINSAPSMIELNSQTIYFCSDHCKEAFLKK